MLMMLMMMMRGGRRRRRGRMKLRTVSFYVNKAFSHDMMR